MADLILFVQSLGFPVALAIYLLWCQREERRKCDERIQRMEELIHSLTDLPTPEVVQRKFPRLADLDD